MHCLNTGYNEIYITSRKKQVDKNHIHYFQGNARNKEWLSKIAKDKKFDVIVDFMVYESNEFKNNIELLLQMTKHYVFLSSSRVYSNSRNKPITEEFPRLLDNCQDKAYLLTDEYALAKAREEDILINRKNKNWTIVRPYITYNSERLQLGTMEKESWLYRAIHGRTIVFTKDVAECLTTLTYGNDVAKGIALIIGKTEAYGEIFHIVGTESMKWKDVAILYQNEIKRLTGIFPHILYLEDDEEFCKAFNNKYQVYYDRLFQRTFDSSKIAKIGGEIDYTPMSKGLIKCLDEFILNKHQFRDINWVTEAWIDRKTGERTNLAEIPTWKSKIKYLLCRYTGFLKWHYNI